MSEENVPGQSKLWPAFAAMAFNLVPVIGVLFWGWSAFALIFLYWAENVVVGVRTLLSMLASGLARGPVQLLGSFGLGAFFCVHFGMFCLVHGIFVMSMFGGLEGVGMGLSILDVGWGVFAEYPNMAFGFASIVLWQVLQFVLFVARGEAGETNPQALMAAPYPRIIVLHFAIIFGGMLVMSLDQPIGGLLVLALMKTSFDVAAAMGMGPQFAPDTNAWAKMEQAAQNIGRDVSERP